jgi:hypothetical protein
VVNQIKGNNRTGEEEVDSDWKEDKGNSGEEEMMPRCSARKRPAERMEEAIIG